MIIVRFEDHEDETIDVGMFTWDDVAKFSQIFKILSVTIKSDENTEGAFNDVGN